MKSCFIGGILIAASLAASGRDAKLSLASSLLEEMTNYDAVARWPEPEFTCKQASSYDRASVAPDKPGWFANQDYSQLIRVEDTAGRRERVMMDVDGPGAVVRFWLTTNARREGKLRVYLDGGDTPALEFPAYDLMAGALVNSPLLHPHTSYRTNGGGGSTLYLPIPYARHCKVTWEEANPTNNAPRYYQLNYRTYPEGTEVETFTRAGLAAAGASLERASRALLTPPPFAGGKALNLERAIEAGNEAALELPAGPGAVRQLEMRLTSVPPKDLEQALRATVLRANFDGEETIWCPLSDFAGCGVGARELKNWYRTVDKDGVMTCRWVMPYQKSGRLSLANLGPQRVTVSLTARVGDWKWDSHSMHFHANWRCEADVPSRPYRDWNFISVTGRGVLVGDVLAVFNPIPAWYGEGDEKIWIDGESFPSHFGTGTEDYYNISWAPNTVYQTPFANSVRVDESHSQGHNTFTRSRNLDTIPFRKGLRFDFEFEHWKETKIDLAGTTYWYGSPGAVSNLKPQVREAGRPIPHL